MPPRHSACSCPHVIGETLSECGTWSHAVISSLGARARGGVVGRLRSVSHVVGPRQGSGLIGWVGSRWVPRGHVRVPHGPAWVRISVAHRYGTVESSVRAHRGLSGHIGFRRVSVGTLIRHDGTRWGSTDRPTVPHRCTIDVRTHAGPSGVPTGPPGPRRDPTDPRRTAGGPQLLLASAVAMVLVT